MDDVFLLGAYVFGVAQAAIMLHLLQRGKSAKREETAFWLGFRDGMEEARRRRVQS